MMMAHAIFFTSFSIEYAASVEITFRFYVHFELVNIGVEEGTVNRQEMSQSCVSVIAAMVIGRVASVSSKTSDHL
jgi:hypothetical protein